MRFLFSWGTIFKSFNELLWKNLQMEEIALSVIALSQPRHCLAFLLRWSCCGPDFAPLAFTSEFLSVQHLDDGNECSLVHLST